MAKKKPTTTKVDPATLDGKELAAAIELSINRLILKLAQRAYTILDRNDISGLATLLRSASVHKHNRRLWEIVENEQLTHEDRMKLIASEYGVNPDNLLHHRGEE